MRGLERDVYLQVLDVLWMQHLENMQHLREGIHWRSVGQRDPPWSIVLSHKDV